jgi:hypothetical protein
MSQFFFRLKPGRGGGATSLAVVGKLKLKTLDNLKTNEAASQVLEVLDNAPISIYIEVTSYEGQGLAELEETLLHEVYLHLFPLAKTMATLKNRKEPMLGDSELLGARLRDLQIDHRNSDRWKELIAGTFIFAKKRGDKKEGFNLFWALAHDLNNHFGVLPLEDQRILAKAVQECIDTVAKNQFQWTFQENAQIETPIDVPSVFEGLPAPKGRVYAVKATHRLPNDTLLNKGDKVYVIYTDDSQGTISLLIEGAVKSLGEMDLTGLQLELFDI